MCVASLCLVLSVVQSCGSSGGKGSHSEAEGEVHPHSSDGGSTVQALELKQGYVVGGGAGSKSPEVLCQGTLPEHTQL